VELACPDSLDVIRKKEGRGRKGLEIGRGGEKGKRRMRRGREGNGEGSGWGERVGKGEGELDLNIYPGAPEFLVTPLLFDGGKYAAEVRQRNSIS